ncbi:MAG TPA: hypothetical protein P5298_11005 [Spirochaetia bacterium]|nr:hypothetical protein [Spirochaetales bacterium]HRW24929.1 hypothetical protein [Spirochaetia bacterium]
MKRTPKTKANPLSPIALAAAVTVAAMAGACDEFSFVSLLSLPDQVVPEELVLTVAQDSVPSGSSVPLEVSGGTLPYTFTLAGSDLYQPTRDRSLGTIDNSKFTAGQAIGTVLITVEDAAGGSAFIEVAVIPPKPVFIITRSGVVQGSPEKANFAVNWTYIDTAMVDGFSIYASIDGNEYSLVATANATDTSIQSQNNVFYYSSVAYRIIAHADSFYSSPEIQTFQVTP